MNLPFTKDGVNWLFLDLNAFLASCEQQDDPTLRGKPVIVVQMLTYSTSAIAASYEAKAFGVKTGTRVSEAKRLCPSIFAVKAITSATRNTMSASWPPSKPAFRSRR